MWVSGVVVGGAAWPNDRRVNDRRWVRVMVELPLKGVGVGGRPPPGWPGPAGAAAALSAWHSSSYAPKLPPRASTCTTTTCSTTAVQLRKESTRPAARSSFIPNGSPPAHSVNCVSTCSVTVSQL